MFTFISLRCSRISRLWTKKFRFEKRCCRDVKEVLSAIPVNTCRLAVEFYTSEESNLHLLLRAWQNYSSKILFISKLKEGAWLVISALPLQVYWKLFKQRGEGTMLGTGEGLNSESRAKRSRGTGNKKDLYVGSKKDPLLSTTAARPAFFQGYAINKAAVGSPVLLSLAICCLFWLLRCLVPTLLVTTSFFTDWSYKGMLWLLHADDCLGPAQFSNGTPGVSRFISKVRRLCWFANASSQN